MRILHLDCGREMRGGQWQSLRLHEGLLERGNESVLLRRDQITPWRLRDRFDIVHAHDARSHSLGALLAKAPLVVSRRVAFPVRNSIASRWKYGRARLFIAVSRFVAGKLREHGIDENRIVTVYDGVPLAEQLARGENILVLPHKGAALAQHADVTVHVSNNLEADLPAARALIYLSECEGLGSGILLAMAYGVPVIASNIGGIPEIVHDGVNGVLVTNNAGAIAQAIRRLQPGMGAAARETVERAFTISHMVNGTIAAYEKVLS